MMPEIKDRDQEEWERERALYEEACEGAIATYKDEFQKGDQVALLDCVVFCASNELQLPEWALNQLAGGFWKYLTGISDNLHSALLSSGQGRHAHSSTERRKENQHQLWFDVVYALKQQGLKGPTLWEKAKKQIAECHRIMPNNSLRFGLRNDKGPYPKIHVPKIDTLKRQVGKMEKAGANPRFACAFMTHGPMPTGPDPE